MLQTKTRYTLPMSTALRHGHPKWHPCPRPCGHSPWTCAVFTELKPFWKLTSHRGVKCASDLLIFFTRAVFGSFSRRYSHFSRSS